MKWGWKGYWITYQPFFALSYILSTIILLMKSLFVGLSPPLVPSERDILAKVALACPARHITSQE